ncbi:MAG: deoxynucleoside kinase [Trueperaceae bacterium]
MSYIVVEGPIGAGKTSLSRPLAEELQARLVLEVVEENPFLALFYADPESYAFKVQVFFLLSRYKQLQDLNQGALFYQHTVSDYLFDKDFIFAALNLRGAEWELYEDLYQQLHPKLTNPDLVVYLRASPNLLLQRISKRARSFEQNMEATYLRNLGEAYDKYFSKYQGSIYTIEAADYDFVDNQEDRQFLLDEILNYSQAA